MTNSAIYASPLLRDEELSAVSHALLKAGDVALANRFKKEAERVYASAKRRRRGLQGVVLMSTERGPQMVFESPKEAVEMTGIAKSTLMRKLHGKDTASWNGLHFRYMDAEPRCGEIAATQTQQARRIKQKPKAFSGHNVNAGGTRFLRWADCELVLARTWKS
jgi:hypothetical protein